MSMRPVFFVCLVACNGLSTELPESTNPSNTEPTLTTSSTPNTTTSSSSTSTTTTPTTTPTTDCVAGSAIQPAIDGASNGDTIYICAGTHPVNLSITRNVALDAESGQSVILDGGGSASTIAVDSGRSLTVRNLEITGGSGGSVAAGGIEASDAIIVCGTPGSGKTTYARRLVTSRMATLLDIDSATERLVRVGLVESGYDLPRRLFLRRVSTHPSMPTIPMATRIG